MKKILIAVLSAVTIFAPMQVAKATDERVVAIIDTAIDSSKFPSIIYEVCFTQNKSCLNKTNFMEGKGSANSLIWPASMLNSVYHGHSMVAASVKTNPNIKIVFVRIADITSSGNSLNSGQSLSQAMDWVSKNASKYSIDALSVSQSRVNWTTCPTDVVISNAIKTLETQNIPTFIATGNDRLTNKVGFPACVNGAIGVGAVDANGTIFHAVTNRGPGLDIVANGSMDVVRYNGTVATTSGTSVANVVAATKYVSQTNMFSQFIAGLTKFLTYSFIK
jgi:hypothetical protein